MRYLVCCNWPKHHNHKNEQFWDGALWPLFKVKESDKK